MISAGFRYIGMLVALATVTMASALTHSQAPRMQAANGVPIALLKKLTRGVNITRWFCYVKGDDTVNFRNYLIKEDLENFKKLGVQYARLCISPEVIYQNGVPNPTNLPLLDDGINRLEKAGLVVLVDLHDNGQMKLDAEDHDNSGFVTFWKAMAKHYKGYGENSTVFELLNEPVFAKNPEVWYNLQRQTVKAIRAIDPDRTILVASTGWNSVDTLLAMKTLDEKNIVYSYHCYDPFVFTHQGASWAGDQQKAMRDVPFPSSPEAVAAMIDKIPAPYKDAVRNYGEQRFGKKYLHDRLNLGKLWGIQHQVPVLLGEFGAYPPVSPVESRATWFEFMRDAIDEIGLPNAIWGYDDALGLGREKTADGKIHLDPVTLKHFFKVSG